MGEANSPHHRKHPITANSPPPSHSPMCDHHHILQQNQQVVEPTDLFSMMHINNRQPPCSAATNPMKRRSPPSSSSSGEPCAKKLFCDQEDPTHYGFSAVPIPLNINSLVNKGGSFPVLRRCVSDPYTSPAPAPEPEQSMPPERGSGLPPLPPRFRRSVSDLSVPSPDKALSCLSSEETATPDSVRLRRMKERLKEMRQWWDEVMKDEEEDRGGREEECAVVAQDDKALAQDDLVGGDSEESVSVDWIERCVSLGFRCPCGKGYEVLLSQNNCYYKLV
ncbi:hypothetical protein AAZX31_09G221500 [Glycine max]|uniref:Uncharacterized protein n=1 Tax=Glycine soja TaxID=3848 RepID=A0A445J5R3_GLYSO|nr:uncharacterized protein LOC114425848 [Glycine soja]RZB93635.1 hypothetical protein D0Y65_025131 [Glycine soja]